MSKLCLLCQENQTDDAVSNNLCEDCLRNAPDYLERYSHLVAAAPELLAVSKKSLEYLTSGEPPSELDVIALQDELKDAIAKAEAHS